MKTGRVMQGRRRANRRAMWLAGWLVCGSFIPTAFAQTQPSWTQQQLGKLPKSETAVHLFDGKTLDGWAGQTEKHFSVENGEIVAKNSKASAPKASTYLVTEKKYRNFRLIFEAKLVESEMHSGIALWGKTVEKAADPFSYQGHLVMFPSNYGFYDLYRRNSIYRDNGVAKKAGQQHDWNRMEILAIGNRIRHVVNGKLVADWSDPKPELCEAGPIGLQLHSNKVPQEVRFRGLVLTEDPADTLVTVAEPAKKVSDSEQPLLSGVNAAMQKFVESHQTSGVVTLVAHQGKLVHLGAVGLADIEGKRPLQDDTIFAIASMTKPVTATAVMMLVDEGKLALDDPISKYIPEFANVKLKDGSAVRAITLKDLMTHTSGLHGDQQNTGTLAETAVALAARPLAFAPGERWQYSPGLSVCGRAVEVASGMPFETFLQKRIFDPLQMTDTTFNPTAAQKARMAKLYRPGKDKQSLTPADHWLMDVSAHRSPNPSGGLFSTARDMSRFYQMVLNGGELHGKRVVSKQAVQQMTSVQTGDLVTGFTPGNGWGLGWCVIRKPQGVSAEVSPQTFGHGGAFGTQGWVDPGTQTIYVLMIQRTAFGNADGSDIRGTFHNTATAALKH